MKVRKKDKTGDPGRITDLWDPYSWKFTTEDKAEDGGEIWTVENSLNMKGYDRRVVLPKNPPATIYDMPIEQKYVTKDSGQRIEYDSGMKRDTNQGKVDFSLILAEGVPFEAQLFTRWAALMTRGAEKYGYRNWEKAGGDPELVRFRESAFRHFMQWWCNTDDGEDHAAAVLFNINAAEFVKWRKNSGSTSKEEGAGSPNSGKEDGGF